MSGLCVISEPELRGGSERCCVLLTASLDGSIGAWERGGERCLGRLRLDPSPPSASSGAGGGVAGGGAARAGEGDGPADSGACCWAVPLQTAIFHDRHELERALFERRLGAYTCAAVLPPKAEGQPEHLLEVCMQMLADQQGSTSVATRPQRLSVAAGAAKAMHARRLRQEEARAKYNDSPQP